MNIISTSHPELGEHVLWKEPKMGDVYLLFPQHGTVPIYLLWWNILLFLEPNFCKVHVYLSSLLKKKKSLDPEPQVWFFSNNSFFSLLRY